MELIITQIVLTVYNQPLVYDMIILIIIDVIQFCMFRLLNTPAAC